MKKLILGLIAVASISTTEAMAQGATGINITDHREKVMFGIKAGANYSNVYDTKGEEFNADGKFGFAGGGFLAIPLGKYIGVQPEVLLSQKGFHATGQILGSRYDFKRTTTYIDVPLFIAFKPSEFLTLLAGPQYSYLLKQKDVFANAVTTIEQETQFKNDNIRKNTFSLAAGFDFNFNHIVFGARAGWDLQNNNGDGSSTTPRYKNSWLQATVGYRL